MMRAAVIGVGAMGRNHARVYREMPETDLVAVADLDEARAGEVVRLYGGSVYTDHQVMLSEVRPDLVSVAVPTKEHYKVGLCALEAGCHVLVEKPIAATLEQGRHMIDRAAQVGRVLVVGHIERYNPAVTELKRRLEEGQLGRIFQIRARRLGPFPARVRDVGVVVDLATHDLDIMRYPMCSCQALAWEDMVKHDLYHDITLAQLREKLAQPVLVDGRHVFDRDEAVDAGFVFRGIGIGWR